MSYIFIFFSAGSWPVLHAIHMHIYFSRTLTCSTCHTYAYLFQPHQSVLHVIHMRTFFLPYAALFYMSYTCIAFSAVSCPVLHSCHAYAYIFQPYADLFYKSYICIPFSVVRWPVLHSCHTYAYLFFSRNPTCSTGNTYAYLFQPEAEVEEGVAGVCETFAKTTLTQVFTVQQHV